MLQKEDTVKIIPRGKKIGTIKTIINNIYYVRITETEVCGYKEDDLIKVKPRQAPAPSPTQSAASPSNPASVFDRVQSQEQHIPRERYQYINDYKAANQGDVFAIQLLISLSGSHSNSLAIHIIKKDGTRVDIPRNNITIIDGLFLQVNDLPTSLLLTEKIVVDYISVETARSTRQNRETCDNCGEIRDDCTCDRCYDCGELVDNCACNLCDNCEEHIDDCTCDREDDEDETEW